MNISELAELLKFASPYSILVITWQNKIVELHVPFKVQLKNDIGELIKGEIEEVEIVKISTNLITVFVVRGDAYYYYHFNIIIE